MLILPESSLSIYHFFAKYWNFQKIIGFVEDSMAAATSYSDTQKLLKHSLPNLTSKIYTNADPILRHVVDASMSN